MFFFRILSEGNLVVWFQQLRERTVMPGSNFSPPSPPEVFRSRFAFDSKEEKEALKLYRHEPCQPSPVVGSRIWSCYGSVKC